LKLSLAAGLIAVFLCTIARDCYPQQLQPVFRHYTVNDGLPSSEVYYTIQDSKGYMWFATDRGVSRFDGYEFENFSTRDGLCDNTVFLIFEDQRSRVWFATYAGCLSYFYQDSIHSFKFNEKLMDYLSPNPIVYSFHVDKTGIIHLGLYGAGHLTIDTAGNIKQNHPAECYLEFVLTEIESMPFCYLSIDRQSEDLTDRGVHIFADKIDTMLLLPKEVNLQAAGHITGLRRANGSSVVSVGDIFFKHGTNGQLVYEKHEKPIISITEDSQEALWLGHYRGGVTQTSEKGEKAHFLSGKSVTAIYEDEEHGFWLTTLEAGVYYTSGVAFLSYLPNAALQMQPVTSITGDGESKIFAGCSNGLVAEIDDTNRLVYHNNSQLNTDSTSTVTGLFYNREEGKLWVVAMGGNWWIRGTHIGQLDKTHSVRVHLLKRNGDLLGGTYSGIYKLNAPDRGTGVASQRIQALEEDVNGNVWVGCPDGLYKLEDWKLNYLGNEHPLYKNRIDDIVEVSPEEIWMATLGDGIIVKTEDTVFNITVNDGLSSNMINSIFPYEGIIWVASNKGLNKLEQVEKYRYSITNYSLTHGLSSNEINGVYVQSGIVWLATNRGIDRFDPAKLSNNAAAPSVRITGLEVNFEEVKLSGDYSFAYDENYLQIHYSGLSFKNAGRIVYKYKMEGLDTNWIYTSNRNVQYTTIPPGDYLFTVSATNGDGTWSTQPANLLIKISPPFWQMWWFKVLSWAILLAGIYAFFKIRILTYNRDVVRALLRVLLSKVRTKKYLVVRIESGLVKIDSEKILWLKAADNYVEVHTKKKTFLVRSTLKSLVDEIPDNEQFLRVHRSYVIRIDKVQNAMAQSVRINEVDIPVGYSHRDSLKVIKKQVALMNI